MSCGRTQSENMPEGTGYYGYVSNINAQFRPGTTCVGNGAGPNQVCDRAYSTRRPVGGPGGIGDPVLIQRSYRSSGCAPTEADLNVPDTLTQHVVFANQDKWNKGAEMTSFSTRSFLSNSQNVTEKDVSMYNLTHPNMWSTGYHGLAPIGDNIPTRLVSGCASTTKYLNTSMDPLSRQSYGSYGMVSQR